MAAASPAYVDGLPPGALDAGGPEFRRLALDELRLARKEGALRISALDAQRLAAYGRMKERVKHAFRRFAELLPPREGNIRLLGTSGTVTTLASVHLALPSYDRRAVDGLMMPVDSMRSVNRMLSRMSFAERAELPCIGAERADLVVAGCAILEAIMDIWPAQTLGVADRGIREGILRSLMAKDGHKL